MALLGYERGQLGGCAVLTGHTRSPGWVLRSYLTTTSRTPRALTTIRQDVGAKGRAAVTALTALIDGKAPRTRTVLRTELVIRDSTAVAPPSSRQGS